MSISKPNDEITNKKIFKDSFTNKNYKRPFSIEKIVKDLNSHKLRDYMNNKDPLIKKKQN